MSADKPPGLFLDLDGTLANSLTVMREAFDQLLSCHGVESTDSLFEAYNGPPLPVIVAELCEEFKLPGPRARILAHYEDIIRKLYLQVRPASGAQRLVETARRAGWTVALVTSTRTALAREWLERVELLANVECIIGGEQCSAGKPAPDPYLLALERTGANVATSIAVEDSFSGARAAAGAGLRTFLLSPSGLAPAHESITAVSSLDDVTERIQ